MPVIEFQVLGKPGRRHLARTRIVPVPLIHAVILANAHLLRFLAERADLLFQRDGRAAISGRGLKIHVRMQFERRRVRIGAVGVAADERLGVLLRHGCGHAVDEGEARLRGNVDRTAVRPACEESLVRAKRLAAPEDGEAALALAVVQSVRRAH